MSKNKWTPVLYKAGIGAILGLIFMISYMLIRFNVDLVTFADGFFLTAFFVFIVGLSSYVSNEGFFDMITYGFQLVPYVFRIQKQKKYDDLIAYKDAKNIKRIDNKLAPLGYIFVSIFFLILGLILYLIYKF